MRRSWHFGGVWASDRLKDGFSVPKRPPHGHPEGLRGHFPDCFQYHVPWYWVYGRFRRRNGQTGLRYHADAIVGERGITQLLGLWRKQLAILVPDDESADDSGHEKTEKLEVSLPRVYIRLPGRPSGLGGQFAHHSIVNSGPWLAGTCDAANNDSDNKHKQSADEQPSHNAPPLLSMLRNSGRLARTNE